MRSGLFQTLRSEREGISDRTNFFRGVENDTLRHKERRDGPMEYEVAGKYFIQSQYAVMSNEKQSQQQSTQGGCELIVLGIH